MADERKLAADTVARLGRRAVVGEELAPGVPNTEIGKDGKQRGYVVLSAEERAKRFVRPVRSRYRHVGKPGPVYALQDLSEEQKRLYGDDYVKFEPYPEDHYRLLLRGRSLVEPSERRPALGKLWSQKDLDAIGKGCGTVTTMGLELAETYAREPRFYGGTFCAGCGAHFPVGEDGEFVWDGTEEKVGT